MKSLQRDVAYNAVQCSARRSKVIKGDVKLKVKLSLGLCLLQNKISPDPPLPRTPRVSFPSRLVSFNLLDVCFNFHHPRRPLSASHRRKSLRYKIPLDWFGDDKVQDRPCLCVLACWWDHAMVFLMCLLDRLQNLRCMNLAETVTDLPVACTVCAWVSVSSIMDMSSLQGQWG